MKLQICPLSTRRSRSASSEAGTGVIEVLHEAAVAHRDLDVIARARPPLLPAPGDQRHTPAHALAKDLLEIVRRAEGEGAFLRRLHHSARQDVR
jgi:hypothetical protein